MKFFLISDNIDTQIGMRLAGIEGVVVHEPDEVRAALANTVADEEVAVILMTEQLVSLCREQVEQHKLHGGRPIVVTIPDRHGNYHVQESINRTIEQAVGMKR